MIDDRLNAALARGGRTLSRFNSYYVFAGLFVLSRGYMVWADRRGALSTDLSKYVAWGHVIADSGQLPVADQSWQYPPLMGALMVAVSSVTSSAYAFQALFLICDAAILGLLLWHRRGPRPNNPAWLYLLYTILIGPILLARFDIVSALFAVAGLLWISRPVTSGVLLGIGASLKLWPGLLLAAYPRGQLPKAITAVFTTMIIINLTLWLWAANAFSFLQGQADRGIQIQAPVALPFMISRALGAPVRLKSQFGAREVIGGGVAAAALIVTLVGIAAIAVIVVQRLRGKLEDVPTADVGLAMVLVMVATSRIGSPQYFIWIAAVAVVCLFDPATRMLPILVLITLGCVFTTLIYPTLYSPLVQGNMFATAVQACQVVTLLAAACWAYLRVLRPAR